MRAKGCRSSFSFQIAQGTLTPSFTNRAANVLCLTAQSACGAVKSQRTHGVARLLERLNCRTRAEAARKASQRGWL